MQKLTLAFARSNKILSKLVRFVTRSRWSHVAIVDIDKGVVIESIGGKGVQETPIASFESRYTKVEYTTIRHRTPNKVLEIARQQLGKSYDIPWVFKYFFNRRGTNEKRFTCSELVIYCIEKGGRKIFRDKSYDRVTPQDIYQLSPEL